MAGWLLQVDGIAGWSLFKPTFASYFNCSFLPRVKENVEHCSELMQLAEELGIGSKVAFLRSISDREKVQL